MGDLHHTGFGTAAVGSAVGGRAAVRRRRGGRAAFDSLRMEKGYRPWALDIPTEHNPYEAGLGFAAQGGKGDFIGREALAKTQGGWTAPQVVCTVLDDPDVVVMDTSWYSEIAGWSGT